MSFDHGSQSLGIRNPFKLYGFVRAITGLLIVAVAAFYIWQSIGELKQSTVNGSILLVGSLLLLAGGLKTLGSGVFQMLRFFVGRSVPTSLAHNFSDTESASSQAESTLTSYTAQSLKSMLVARKNVTFQEPNGWTSRLVHTLIPKLLFLPIPIRNLVQRYTSAVITSIALISAFLIAWIVISSGVVGIAGDVVFTLFSILLLIYLTSTWFKLKNSLSRKAETEVDNVGSGRFIVLISAAIIIPVGLGILLNLAVENSREVQQLLASDFTFFTPEFIGFSAWPLLGLLAVLIIITCAPILLMIVERTRLVNPVTEVSEHRDNWEEEVHPKELFINLENIVLANRRYKEMPNRIYSELKPEIEQQDDKGSFDGDLLIETQPAYQEINHSNLSKTAKLIGLLLSQVLILVGSGLFLALVFSIIELANYVIPTVKQVMDSGINEYNFASIITPGANLLVGTLMTLFSWRLVKSFGLSSELFVKVMFSEIQFESLLMYFKCEGTYRESRLSTGMSMHDSTRSENTVVSSSFTPWVITSRIVSNTFAQEGAQNIEHARHVMEMHSNRQEMDAIVSEVLGFISNRSTLASVKTERDLAGINTLNSINQQSLKSKSGGAIGQNYAVIDDEAAGYIRQQEDSTSPEKE